MSNTIKYPVDQITQNSHNSVINDRSSAALKAYYHDMTLAFIKDNGLHTLKYTELNQSLSSFLLYLLSNYKNDHEKTKQRYRPLREAMKIYSTKYNYEISDFGDCIILQKEAIHRINYSENIRYVRESVDDDEHVCVINYREILHQTTNATKKIRENYKNNNTISKKKVIEDLKKALSVPVKSEKAMKMMLSMGWDGGSLGVRGDGITEPIMPELDLKAGAGLGHINKPDVKCNESRYEFIIDVLEKFLKFLKSDQASTEVICPRKVTPKDRGFIMNMVRMVNINRRVEVNDEERGVLLNQIYEMSCLKRFHVTGSVIGKAHVVKFTKAVMVRQVDSSENTFKPVSMTSNSRKFTVSSPTFDPGRGSVTFASEALLKHINYKYVSPFTPLNTSRQNLNNLVFRTTTLIFILDFNKSHLDQIEVMFEKVLNLKERGFVSEIVDAINKGHNKKGAKTKVENHLLNEIWATGKTHYLAAKFGSCNVSFTLEKIFDKSKANPKRVKLNSSHNRNEEASMNDDYLSEIFANIDEAFPPIVWTKDNDDPPRDEVIGNNYYFDYSDTDSYVNKKLEIEKTKKIKKKVKKPNNEKADNLIIVKNVNSNNKNSENVRKIYVTSDPYVMNTSNQSCDRLKSDNGSNIRNGITNHNVGKCQTFTATSIGNSDTQNNIKIGIMNSNSGRCETFTDTNNSNTKAQINIKNGFIDVNSGRSQTFITSSNGNLDPKTGRCQTYTTTNKGNSDTQSIKNGIISSYTSKCQTFTDTNNNNSDAQNNIKNRIINPNISRCQTFTATSNGNSDTQSNKNGIINPNSTNCQTAISNRISDNNKDKIIDKNVKEDAEEIADVLDNGDKDDFLNIDLSVCSSYDSDLDDLLNDEISPKRNTKTTSRTESAILSDLDEFELLSDNDETGKVESKEDYVDVLIGERVKHMDIKGNNEDELYRKKRLRSDSDDSDLMIFKKYKTVDRITHVNLTPTDSAEASDNVDFVRKVQTVISTMLDVTNELPLLKCHGYRNGALVYSCHNEKSLSWLKTHCVTNGGDIKITVTDELLIETIKMSLKINCYIDENYKKIFDRLEMYNRGLSTKEWVWLREEKFNGYIVITFKVNELSFNYIQSKNYRLFVGIDEAQFTIVWN